MTQSFVPGSGPMGPQAPIVGRDAERVLLQEQLSAARQGLGRVVIVGGEAGIGKTALTRDLIVTATAGGFRALVGHCYDLIAAPPYGVWLDLIDGYRRREGSDPDPPPPPMLAGIGLPAISSQAELVAEVMAFLRDLSARGPVLLVLEDLHWADPESLEVLRYVASHLAGIRMLLVITYRVDELTRSTPLYRQLPALVRESDGMRLDLKRLDRASLTDLVALRYALSRPSAASLVTYLERHSDGNPFFAVELLRTLEEQERGGLVRTGAGWTLQGLDHVVVPELVKQVIDDRIARLGDATREPLAIAAVIGQDVDIDLWAKINGLGADGSLALIERGAAWSLFTVHPDGTRIQFVHALTREALYEGILPIRRRAIHVQVARALQASRPQAPDPIAYHLRQAGDPEAPAWLIRAGERAQRAYAWLTAHDRFLAAANLLEDLPGEQLTRARLLYRCGRLLRYADAARGIEHLRLASRLAELAQESILAADARYSRGLLHCFADEWEVGIREMSAGIDVLEALPPEEARAGWTTVNWMADALPTIDLPAAADVDPAAQRLIAAGLNHRRGSLPWFLAATGHLPEAEAMARLFVELVEGARSGPLVLSATGHANFGLGIALSSVGEVKEARDAFDRARDIYEWLDHHAVTAFTRLTELTDLVVPFLGHDAGERRRVAREAERALERAGGALPVGSSPRRARLVTLFLDGEWGEASSIVEDGGSHGNYLLRRQVTQAMAPIALHQGRFDEAWKHIREVLPDGPEAAFGTAVFVDALMLQRIAIDLCLCSGDLDTARLWLDANARWLDASGALLGRAEHVLARAKIEAAEGKAQAALASAGEALELAGSPVQALAQGDIHRFQGRVLLDVGAPDAAETAYRQALAIADSSAIPYARALSLVGQAAALDDGRAGEAMALATEARATLATLGAAPALADAEELLTRLAPITIPAGLHAGLTARERDVLRLTAEGLTDSEIGERLFISSRTVSQHLRSVYGKLGLRTRAAATRYAIEHGLS